MMRGEPVWVQCARRAVREGVRTVNCSVAVCSVHSSARPLHCCTAARLHCCNCCTVANELLHWLHCCTVALVATL
jgi:hypothetical protein